MPLSCVSVLTDADTKHEHDLNVSNMFLEGSMAVIIRYGKVIFFQIHFSTGKPNVHYSQVLHVEGVTNI